MQKALLDIMIYAHDGRGLGHASRAVAIGMALRRLFPQLRVALVTGCANTQELIGPARLDWIKLPSYRTKVHGGTSTGVSGWSLHSDKELSLLRARIMADLMNIYKPRLMLADHMPQGKHRELLPAMEAAQNLDTLFVLGVRAVAGNVKGLWSDMAARVFREYYRALIWYGDSNVLGWSQAGALEKHFNIRPMEAGYVCRLGEWERAAPGSQAGAASLAGTVSAPWLGEHSLVFLRALAMALGQAGGRWGCWRIHLEAGRGKAFLEVKKMFQDLAFCQVEEPGPRYVRHLLSSRMAVLYGGYNSLVDVLYAGIPCIAVLREMHDCEQDKHVQSLAKVAGGVSFVRESHADCDLLAGLLEQKLKAPKPGPQAVNLEGAPNTARLLAGLLERQAWGGR